MRRSRHRCGHRTRQGGHQRGTRSEHERHAHVQVGRFGTLGGGREGHACGRRRWRLGDDPRSAFVHPIVETASAGERGSGRHRRRLPLSAIECLIRGVRAFLDRGHGAHREVFAVRLLCAGCVGERSGRGEIVVAGLEFMDDPAEIAEACSDHTDAFFESVECDTANARGEGRVWEGVVTAVDNALPFTFDCGKGVSVRYGNVVSYSRSANSLSCAAS